jgi:hypothetical protein
VRLGWERLDIERSGKPRRLPGSILPPKTREEPLPYACQPMPRIRDVRRAVMEPVQKL